MIARRSSTWLPTQHTGSICVDELVSNRALTLVCVLCSFPFLPLFLDLTYRFLFSRRQSHTVAHKELPNQHKSAYECEHRDLYEEPLWCLYALQDELLQNGNPPMEPDGGRP
jgi:hypothetical protein